MYIHVVLPRKTWSGDGEGWIWSRKIPTYNKFKNRSGTQMCPPNFVFKLRGRDRVIDLPTWLLYINARSAWQSRRSSRIETISARLWNTREQLAALPHTERASIHTSYCFGNNEGVVHDHLMNTITWRIGPRNRDMRPFPSQYILFLLVNSPPFPITSIQNMYQGGRKEERWKS